MRKAVLLVLASIMLCNVAVGASALKEMSLDCSFYVSLYRVHRTNKGSGTARVWSLNVNVANATCLLEDIQINGVAKETLSLPYSGQKSSPFPKASATSLYHAIAAVINGSKMSQPRPKRPDEVLSVGIRVGDESVNADIAIPNRESASKEVTTLLTICNKHLKEPNTVKQKSANKALENDSE
jgi:hypothetical protein